MCEIFLVNRYVDEYGTIHFPELEENQGIYTPKGPLSKICFVSQDIVVEGRKITTIENVPFSEKFENWPKRKHGIYNIFPQNSFYQIIIDQEESGKFLITITRFFLETTEDNKVIIKKMVFFENYLPFFNDNRICSLFETRVKEVLTQIKSL